MGAATFVRYVRPAHGDTASMDCTRPAGRPRRPSACAGWKILVLMAGRRWRQPGAAIAADQGIIRGSAFSRFNPTRSDAQGSMLLDSDDTPVGRRFGESQMRWRQAARTGLRMQTFRTPVKCRRSSKAPTEPMVHC
jgi:hypothetical protein